MDDTVDVNTSNMYDMDDQIRATNNPSNVSDSYETATLTASINDSMGGNKSESYTDQRFLVFGLYAGISCLGVLFHTVVIVAIAQVVRGNKLTSFYVLVLNLYAVNLIMALIYLLYACPCIISTSQVYGDNVGLFFGGLQTADFIAEVVATFLVTINRALAIGANNLNRKLFEKRLSFAYCCLCWLLGVALVITSYFSSCVTVFDPDHFYFTDICTSVVTTAFSFSSLIVYVCVYGVAVFYLYAVFAMSRQLLTVQAVNVQENVRRHRFRLLCQAFFIWLALLSDIISYRVVPLLLEGLPAVLATGIIVLGHTLVAPLCMILFSGDIRRQVFKLICKSARHNIVSSVSGTKVSVKMDNQN